MCSVGKGHTWRAFQRKSLETGHLKSSPDAGTLVPRSQKSFTCALGTPGGAKDLGDQNFFSTCPHQVLGPWPTRHLVSMVEDEHTRCRSFGKICHIHTICRRHKSATIAHLLRLCAPPGGDPAVTRPHWL